MCVVGSSVCIMECKVNGRALNTRFDNNRNMFSIRLFFVFFFDYLKSRTTAVFSFYFDVGACWVDYDNRLKSIGFGLALG